MNLEYCCLWKTTLSELFSKCNEHKCFFSKCEFGNFFNLFVYLYKTPQPGPDPSYNETDVHLEVPPDRRSLTSIVSTASSTDGGTSGGVPAGSGGEYQDMETDGGVLKNRQFVYKELVATEQDYIKDLSTVIDVS